MGLIKYFNSETQSWEIVAAADAANISLHNEYLLDADEATISTARAFQKINNRLSKLEHNLAWIYLNGAKGGSGGSGGSSSTYTITIKDNKLTFYTSSNSVTISMMINSGSTKKSFYVNAINMSNGKYLVQAELHSSMTYFNFTINNLPSSTNYIYLQAYDSSDNYTELVEITVNVGSIGLGLATTPNATYVIGANNSTAASFLVSNKTGDVAYLLTYQSRESDPLQDALDLNLTYADKFGATYISSVPSSGTVGTYAIDFEEFLALTSVGKSVTFKTVLYLPTIGFTSSYYTNTITVSSGTSLVAILYNLGESESECILYPFKLNSYVSFGVLLYYEPTDISQFYYKYSLYNMTNDEAFYSSNGTLSKATSGYTLMNCPTSNFAVGDYMIVFEASADGTYTEGSTYSKAIGYFTVTENDDIEFKDYPGALLARFGAFNYPDAATTTWNYQVPTSGDYAFTTWPASTSQPTTTLNIINKTNTTGIESNGYNRLNLSGTTYATIDVSKYFVNSSDNYIFGPGFSIMTTYEYNNVDSRTPSNETILSFGTYEDGELTEGFEINSDYITVAYQSSKIKTKTPIKAENLFGSDSDLKTTSTTVALNVWVTKEVTSVTNGLETTIATVYLALYINGSMYKCMLVSRDNSAWVFDDKKIYLGCRNDLTNLADCCIYDFKLYCQKQSDLSIVHNWVSSVELASKTTSGISDTLDLILRKRNLFSTSGGFDNLLFDPSTGDYYDDESVVLSRIKTSYNTSDYELDYPIISITDETLNSDLYQVINATWNAGDKYNGELITEKSWKVNVNIYTKYGETNIFSNDDELKPTISIQGTSTLANLGKNLEFKSGKVDNDTDKLLQINGWLPENEFTWKADVVDSAHANNVVIGNFINNTSYMPNYEGNGYSASSAELGNKIKKTSAGFPCLIFITYVDGSTHFLGVYNFNLGRYAYFNLGLKKLESFEYDSGDNVSEDGPHVISNYKYSVPDNVYSMEVADNFGDPELMFTLADEKITSHMLECRYTSDNEATAISKITSNLCTVLAKGINNLSYAKKTYNEDYDASKGEELFPTITDANGNIQYWQGDSVSASEETINEALDLEVARKYLVVILVFGMVDSSLKNMVLRSWNGKKWYTCFYDMDSALKKDNAGAANVPYNAHYNYYFNLPGNQTAGDSFTTGVTWFPKSVESDDWSYVYAGMKSADDTTPNRIWNIIRYCDTSINNDSTSKYSTLAKYYWDLRTSYIPDPELFIEDNFVAYVNKTGPALFNYDYRKKYVSYGQVWDGSRLVSNTSNSLAEYLDGPRIAEVKDWFVKRIKFLDSVYLNWATSITSLGDNCYFNKTWNARQQAASTTSIQPLTSDQQIKILYQVSSDNPVYLWINETETTYSLTTQSLGNLWYLKGAGNITSFDNFNTLGWVHLGNSAWNFTLLEKLNLSGLTILGWSDTLSNMPNLKDLNMYNTVLKSDTLSSFIVSLSAVKTLQKLNLGGTCNVTSFTLPTTGSLQELSMLNNANIISIPTTSDGSSVLLNQSGLAVLQLKGTNIKDLSGNRALSNLPSLKTLTLPDTLLKLEISNCGIEDLTITWSDTTKLSNLTSVVIYNCLSLKSISLSGLNNLTTISIAECPNIETINLYKVTANSVTIKFSELHNLKSLNIALTDIFTELDLTNCPDISDFNAQQCRSLKSVKCTNNNENPIELIQQAFKDCTSLTTLTGNFLILGASVFENCSVLQFDKLLNSGDLVISFDQTVSTFSKCFKGCSLLGTNSTSTIWIREFLKGLGSSTTDISYMFANTGALFSLSSSTPLFTVCANLTNIEGLFENTNVCGYISKDTLGNISKIINASYAFANSGAARYISNNIFKADSESPEHNWNFRILNNVDYIFQDNTNIKSVVSEIDYTEVPLQSKDFFYNLNNCIHSKTKTDTSDNTSISNPDWPYPWGVFSGTSIKMEVNLDANNHPYLFHLSDLSYKKEVVYLEDKLYSGIKLILDESCDSSYLFGGTSHEVGTSTDDIIGYIPKFARITSPFTASTDLKLNLAQIKGEEFFDESTTSFIQPFSGMALTDATTIPVDLFKGASKVESLEGFFLNLGLKTPSGASYEISTDLFADCTSLKNISYLFSGCNEFKITLNGRIFQNCPLVYVQGAFLNSAILNIPEELFYNAQGLRKITNMSNVFSGCYNLGYGADYLPYYVSTDSYGTKCNWSDHVTLLIEDDAETEIVQSSYSVPHDLFHYCAANASISNVLGSLFWKQRVATYQGDNVYKITEGDKWIGPNCTIPSDILLGEQLKLSTTLTYIFANTHFQPSYTEVPTKANNWMRGNLYPDGLFNGFKNLSTITGMFANTIIDPYCMINSDLFQYTDGDSIVYLPLTDISYCWYKCTFLYLATEDGEEVGSGLLDPEMFDKFTQLTNMSYLFGNDYITASQYGLVYLTSKLFENWKTDGGTINIGYMFAYNPLNAYDAGGDSVEITAPTFSLVSSFTNTVRTYLAGISESKIANADDIKLLSPARYPQAWDTTT